ncbi:ATP-dependent DNA helicase, partial [Candidatus Woesearchaeota archaeon]|nr:ATP-dependent DNA helicase [Candidatus Woesearchaeota archaeon]
PVKNQDIITHCSKTGLCPYYTTMELTKKANIIIGDYYYIFHQRIRDRFMAKSENELEDAIVIVDEAHNLPSRIKDLATSKLSNTVIKRAIKEAVKHKQREIANRLQDILTMFITYAANVRVNNKTEMHVIKEDFINKVARLGEYELLMEELEGVGDAIREEHQLSYIGAVGQFLKEWLGPDTGYTRILSLTKGLREERITLSHRCLDPSIISAPVIKQAHSTIFMSGTLTPTSMYQAVLGVENAVEKTYPSPFPEKNKLNLIIPKTSTKFTSRSETQYQNIAEVLTQVVEKVPGNTAIFFPSYYLLEEVNKHFQTATTKTVFTEQQAMNTTEKEEFLDRFRQYKDTGAVLMGVITGNFGEGIDLPGDELKCVVIVGLPLQKPNLETEALIKYYDDKFKKGWDYGYLFPAFNKTLQSAGRCIRSETDRGVVVFLDERYSWPNYK